MTLTEIESSVRFYKKAAQTVHTDNEIKHTMLSPNVSAMLWSWNGKDSFRWDVVKENATKQEEVVRHGETGWYTEWERASCGLNSGQLFKACACSWVGAALLKVAASEQGTHRLAGEKQHHFQRTTTTCWIITAGHIKDGNVLFIFPK